MSYNLKENFKDIFRRLIKRDFSGNTGITVKNGIFQFSTTLFGKIGSLFFTAILARLLMPELFGLYSLALSTITIFATFSEVGIDSTLTRFLSWEFGRKKEKHKARDYTIYLGRLRLFLSFISVLVLIISARFISDTYYQKPLFLALIAGALYILAVGAASFLRSILQASNYFKGVLYNELIFQVVRLIVIPLLILFSLKHLFSNEIILFFIILGLGISYLASLIFSWFSNRKKFKYLIEDGEKINPSEKKRVNRFIIPAAATVITTIFFGSVDMVMLGRFVLSEYIGYYRAAFTLVAAITPLISFSVVLLPIFSRLKKQQLEIGFKKAVSMTFLLSAVSFLFVFLFAPLLIHIIYGNLYEPAINLLRVFSLILISTPLLSTYISYFAAREKPAVVTKRLIYALIVNIVLNILAILLLKNYGNLAMVYGVTIATIISNWFYMISLMINKKRKFK